MRRMILLLALLFAVQVRAADITRYLDGDLTTGANDGTSEANAWQSMADAETGLEALSGANIDGTDCTLLVNAKAGGYDEEFYSSVWDNTTRTDYLIVKANTGESPTFNGVDIRLSSSTYIRWEGLIFDGPYTYQGYWAIVNGDYCYFEDCIFKGPGNNLATQGTYNTYGLGGASDYFTINNCTFTADDSATFGGGFVYAVAPSGTNVTISDCLIQYCGYGIRSGYSTDTVTVADVNIHHCAYDAFHYQGGTDSNWTITDVEVHDMYPKIVATGTGNYTLDAAAATLTWVSGDEFANYGTAAEQYVRMWKAGTLITGMNGTWEYGRVRHRGTPGTSTTVLTIDSSYAADLTTTTDIDTVEFCVTYVHPDVMQFGSSCTVTDMSISRFTAWNCSEQGIQINPSTGTASVTLDNILMWNIGNYLPYATRSLPGDGTTAGIAGILVTSGDTATITSCTLPEVGGAGTIAMNGDSIRALKIDKDNITVTADKYNIFGVESGSAIGYTEDATSTVLGAAATWDAMYDVDANDFTPASGSVIIDYVPIGYYTSPTVDGEVRTNPSDAGCYEFATTVQEGPRNRFSGGHRSVYRSRYR